jgi:hypothetical protein
METMIDCGRIPTRSVGYRKYEIDIIRCPLTVGESVTPETIVGAHHESGHPVRAGLHGRVATMYFNPMHDSFMIMIIDHENSN